MSISRKLLWHFKLRSAHQEDDQILNATSPDTYLWVGSKTYRINASHDNETELLVNPLHDQELAQQNADAEGPSTASPSMIDFDIPKTAPAVAADHDAAYIERVEMFEHVPRRFWIIFVADVLVTLFMLGMGSYPFAVVLGFLYMAFLTLACAWLRLYRWDLVHKYHYPLNALMGSQYSCPPSSYSPASGSLAMIALCLYKLSIIICVVRFNGGNLYDCFERGALDQVDDASRDCYLVRFVYGAGEFLLPVPYLFLLAQRFSLTKVTENSFVSRAATIEMSNRFASSILCRTELFVEELLDERAAIFQNLAGVLSLLVWVCSMHGASKYVLLSTYSATEFSSGVSAWVFCIACLFLSNWLCFLIIVKMAFGIYATFEGCHRRMQVLLEYISLDTYLSVKQFDAWWRTRTFYVEVLLPVAYNLCDASTVASIIIFLLCTLYWVLSIISFIYSSSQQTVASFLFAQFIYTAILAVSSSSMFISLAKACVVYETQISHCDVLGKYVTNLRLKKIVDVPRLSAISCTNSVPDLHQKLFGPEPLSSDTEEDLDKLIDLLQDFIAKIKAFDSPPYVLGIPITPWTLSSMVVSVVSTIVISLIAYLQSTLSTSN